MKNCQTGDEVSGQQNTIPMDDGSHKGKRRVYGPKSDVGLRKKKRREEREERGGEDINTWLGGGP
jgi:hypothetical protein